MSFYCIILLVAALLAVAGGREKEYEQVCFEDLGCFSTAPPFTAPGRTAELPDDPEDIQTEFWLFTRKNSVVEQKIRAKDVEGLTRSNYDGSKPTKFLMHGFLDRPQFGGTASWMRDAAKQYLIAEDLNFFVVDWRKGAMSFYPKAAANARLVGAQLAQIAKFLVNETGADIASFHLIGHSLGAQLAGYAGKLLPGLGRITGLDPAGPFFQNVDVSIRLDASDANFVDIIHADAADPWAIENAFWTGMLHGMGLMQPIGHVDVYPNGGNNQPGCKFQPIYLIIKDGIEEGMRYIVACDHMRSYNYLFETISSSCPWRSYRCDGGYSEFKTGRCLRCPVTGDKTKDCNGVGYTTTQPSDGSAYNKFYMITGDKPPYCRYHYHVQLTLKNDKNKDQKGKVWVKLSDGYVQTNFIQLGEDNFYLKAGATYDFLVVTKEEIRDISSVELKWVHDAAFYEINQWHLFKPTIKPASIQVFSGEFQREVKFCDDAGELKSKSSHRLTKKC